MKKLGIPTTLGELRKMTEQYPDETLLQFRNEPRHELLFNQEQGLIFQEEPSADIHIALKKIIADNAQKNNYTAIDPEVTKLCRAISYLECQMSMVTRFTNDEDKEKQKESIKKVITTAAKILQQP